MGIISRADFDRQQAYLGSGYYALVECQNVMQSGLNLVVASTDIQVELDMLSPYSLNAENVNVDQTSALFRQAMTALQRHITDGSGQTFNDYLYVNGWKVGSGFAFLSGLLGYGISPENIE